MTDIATTVKQYLSLWNEPDPATRGTLIADLFSPGIRYTDPLASVTGHDALNTLIGAAQQQFPGLAFTPGDPPDHHHDQARFTWHLTPSADPSAEPVATGFDVIELGPDGRIVTVLGFLDKVPG
ncbi:nuclear transport factor 2 family protein [Winogradskya humida]|uniref:Isomerase n=1 Tax=Winogradskya humida TaxID=113566 RepID=A0ABQ3ZG29_9ACTN|nr:nuclear transport factor 2 family protein [Actinoplanes humidus]GIE17227.1 isomerase [Actinoplanes humidus]